MITCNGIVGLSLLVGTLRHALRRVQRRGHGDRARDRGDARRRSASCCRRSRRAGPARSSRRPSSRSRRSPRSRSTALFVFVQTVRHRDYFLPGRRRRPTTPRRTPRRRRAAPRSTQPRPAAGLARRGRRARQDRVARDRGRRRRDRRPAVGGRRRDRAARAAARDARRGPQRAPRPHADELQPRARLGDGEHRADDPRDRGRVDLARRAARARPRLDADRAARRSPCVVAALTVLPGRATLQEGGVHLVLFAAFLFLAVNP